jgi:TolA-binding protein
VNKQKFVEFIKKPADLTAQDLIELEEALKVHPYFQGARLMLAKGARVLNTADQKEKTATAAVYANDRIMLKKFINHDVIFLRTPKAIETEHTKRIIAPLELEVKIESHKEVIEEEKIIIESKLVEKTSPLSKEESVDKATKVDSTNLDHLIDDLWHDVEEMRKSKARLFELEKQIEEDDAVVEALKRATQKVNKDAEPKANVVEPQIEDQEVAKVEEEKQPKEEKKADIEIKAASKEVKPTVEKEKKAPAKSTSKTAKSKEKPTGPTPVVLAPLDPEIPAPIKTTPTNTGSKKEIKVPKALQDDIIDNFIRTNPSMPSGDQIQENASGDLSGNSGEIHPDIASEYLAEIFLEQGKKDRAVEIYKTLSLKFPEKKSFFAALIKKLN